MSDTFGNQQSGYFSYGWSDANREDYIISKDEVLIVPVTAQGTFLLIGEPSSAFNEEVLLLPGGSQDNNELPEDTARRELQEEIGLYPGQLIRLGILRPWSKYLQVQSTIFLGLDLSPSSLKGDEQYAIKTYTYDRQDIDRLILTGKLTDARTVAAMALALAKLPTLPGTPFSLS